MSYVVVPESMCRLLETEGGRRERLELSASCCGDGCGKNECGGEMRLHDGDWSCRDDGRDGCERENGMGLRRVEKGGGVNVGGGFRSDSNLVVLESVMVLKHGCVDEALPSKELRFRVGDVVLAKTDSWCAGVVIATHDAHRVYRIRLLCSGSEVWAPKDTEEFVRPASADTIQQFQQQSNGITLLSRNVCVEDVPSPSDHEALPAPDEVDGFLKRIGDLVSLVDSVRCRMAELYQASTRTGQGQHECWKVLAKSKLSLPQPHGGDGAADAVVDLAMLEALMDGAQLLVRAVDDHFCSAVSEPVSNNLGVAIRVVQKTRTSGVAMPANRVAQSLSRAVMSISDRSLRAMCVVLQLPLHKCLTPCELLQPIQTMSFAPTIAALLVMRMMERGLRERLVKLPLSTLRRFAKVVDAMNLSDRSEAWKDTSPSNASSEGVLVNKIGDAVFALEPVRRQLWHCFPGGMCFSRFPANGNLATMVAGGYGFAQFRIHNAARMLIDERLVMSPEFLFSGHRWVLVAKRLDAPAPACGGSKADTTLSSSSSRIGLFLRCRCVGCCKVACSFAVKIVNQRDRDESIEFSTEHVYIATNPETQQWGNDVVTTSEIFSSTGDFLVGDALSDLEIEIRLKVFANGEIPSSQPINIQPSTKLADRKKKAAPAPEIDPADLLRDLQRQDRIKQIRVEIAGLPKRECQSRESLEVRAMQSFRDAVSDFQRRKDAIEVAERQEALRREHAAALEAKAATEKQALVERLFALEADRESLEASIEELSEELADLREARLSLQAHCEGIVQQKHVMSLRLASQKASIEELECARQQNVLDAHLDSFLINLDDMLQRLEECPLILTENHHYVGDPHLACISKQLLHLIESCDNFTEATDRE